MKELMRRAAQYWIRDGADGALQPGNIDDALEEMLFAGGSLNAKLLGASEVTAGTPG
jgi:hypothetical protein